MSILTVEGLCNQALDMIGFKGRRIGSIYDGTPAARVALEHYGATRDELLNVDMPYWSQRQTQLTLLDTTPDNYTGWSSTAPPLDYKYEYAYPSDCIQPMFILVTPVFRPIWRPRFIPFDVFSRASSRTIVTNAPNAILVYVGQVLDPDLWQDDFVAKFVAAMAQKMQMKLGEKVEQHPNNPG